jgi:hypothetical protein
MHKIFPDFKVDMLDLEFSGKLVWLDVFGGETALVFKLKDS